MFVPQAHRRTIVLLPIATEVPAITETYEGKVLEAGLQCAMTSSGIVLRQTIDTTHGRNGRRSVALFVESVEVVHITRPMQDFCYRAWVGESLIVLKTVILVGCLGGFGHESIIINGAHDHDHWRRDVVGTNQSPERGR